MYSTNKYFFHTLSQLKIFDFNLLFFHFLSFHLALFQNNPPPPTPPTYLKLLLVPISFVFPFLFPLSLSHKPHSSLVTVMQLSSALESCTCFVPGVSYTPLAYTMISSPYSKALRSNASCSYSSCLDSIPMIVFTVSNHV